MGCEVQKSLVLAETPPYGLYYNNMY